MKIKTTLGAALMATAMLASPAMAKTFDITTGLGNAVFQYGSFVPSTAAFTPTGPSDCSNIGISGLCYRSNGEKYQVIAQHSATELLLHPGPNADEGTGITFQAPHTGVYSLNLAFTRGDTGDGVGVYLYTPATGIYSAGTVNGGYPSLSVSNLLVNLTKGQVLGFGIDRGPANYYNDSTFVSGSITGAVPEPATWAMMILGMGAVGFAMRRRKAVRTTVRYA